MEEDDPSVAGTQIVPLVDKLLQLMVSLDDSLLKT